MLMPQLNLRYFCYTINMKHTHTETDLPIENQYPKLVRDKIPEMIERDGKTAEVHVAEDAEYVRFLLRKLVEESTEPSEAESSDHESEEFADVREVLLALQGALNLTETEIEEVQTSKRAERGGFNGRLILDSLPE